MIWATFADDEKPETSYVIVTAGPSETFKMVKNAERTSLKVWRDHTKPIFEVRFAQLILAIYHVWNLSFRQLPDFAD